MRSGLWMLAFIGSTHTSVGLTEQGSITILIVAFVFFVLDIVEYIKNLWQ